MIYRECEITPEYVGFGWHHPDYDGPDDDGGAVYAGHGATVFDCKAQIDDLYDDLDAQERRKFQLWAGCRV